MGSQGWAMVSSHQVEKWRRHAQWFVYQELGSEEFWKNMLPSLFVRIVAYVTKTAACCQHDTNTTHQPTHHNKQKPLPSTNWLLHNPPPLPYTAISQSLFITMLHQSKHTLPTAAFIRNNSRIDVWPIRFGPIASCNKPAWSGRLIILWYIM